MTTTASTLTPDPTAERVVEPAAMRATAAPSPAASPAPEADELDPAQGPHYQEAEVVIRRNLLLSAATGLIPFPMIDSAASAAIDMKMLMELAAVYGVEFRGDVGKSAIGSFLSALGPAAVGGAIGSSALAMTLSSLPGIGMLVRAATQPALHAAFTLALGKVFQQHFASGGTFLTFEPKASMASFRERFAETRRSFSGRAPAHA